MSPAYNLEPNKTYVFTYTDYAFNVMRSSDKPKAEATDKHQATDKPQAEATAMPPLPPLQFTATVVNLYGDPFNSLCVVNMIDFKGKMHPELTTMPFSWIESFTLKET